MKFTIEIGLCMYRVWPLLKHKSNHRAFVIKKTTGGQNSLRMIFHHRA